MPITLKRDPIPCGADKPGNAQFDFGGFCGVCMHQAGSAFDDAEPAEEFSLA